MQLAGSVYDKKFLTRKLHSLIQILGDHKRNKKPENF